MIFEIMPTKVYLAQVSNLELVQEEVSRAVQAADWAYNYEQAWGRTHKFADDSPFTTDVLAKYKMVNLLEEINKGLASLDPLDKFLLDRISKVQPVSWLTRYDKGDYAHEHDHLPSLISGCYYHKVDGEDSNFTFVNPIVGQSDVSMRVKEGSLLLFPSGLRHKVMTNSSDSERISLAFNIG
jgi:hypothetical protein